MKIMLGFIIFFSSPLQASNCIFTGTHLDNLKENKNYELEYSLKIPFPLKLFEILEKRFGKFSKKDCENSITATKIKYIPANEYYYAFYTNENKCDGGNSYGVVFKSSESKPTESIGVIEDSYIECL